VRVRVVATFVADILTARCMTVCDCSHVGSHAAHIHHQQVHRRKTWLLACLAQVCTHSSYMFTQVYLLQSSRFRGLTGGGCEGVGLCCLLLCLSHSGDFVCSCVPPRRVGRRGGMCMSNRCVVVGGKGAVRGVGLCCLSGSNDVVCCGGRERGRKACTCLIH
jgi:hypothetical protein